MAERYMEYMPVRDLAPALTNPKRHDLEYMRGSLKRFGFIEPIVMDERTERLVAGHGRSEILSTLEALGGRPEGWEGDWPPEGVTVAEDGSWLAPVSRGWFSRDDEDAAAAGITLNRGVELGGWDPLELAGELERLHAGRGLEGTGFTPDQWNALVHSLEEPPPPDPPPPPPGPTLADRFLVPPFSVLDARQGYWQERKRQWLALGIRSEEGRGRNLLKMSDTVLAAQQGQRLPNRSVPASDSGNDPQFFYKKRRVERELGRELTTEEFLRDHYEGADAYVGGTSIFDPVLCELAYRWWCPAGGRVLDPFAGGSVRGVVAACLGLHYHGVDLRREQVEADIDQWEALRERGEVGGSATYTHGDARHDQPEGPFDLLFTCPPYFDLEQYSEDPADLSNASSFDAFLADYHSVMRQAAERLADDRFAVVVIGEIRDPRGLYRGLVPSTIRAMQDAGLSYYNEAILVTAVGSLALRAARIFGGGRKLAKGHQNVLVFCKGDPQRAAAGCSPVEVVDPASLFGVVLEPSEQITDEPAAVLAEEPDLVPAPPGPAAAPGWARGFSVGRLRQLAALWERHDRGLPLGAFSRAREADIAGWAAGGQLHVMGDEAGEPRVTLVSRVAKMRQPVADFRGQTVGHIAPGDRIVSRLAAEPGWEGGLPALLGSLWKGERLWLDAWQENPADRWLCRSLQLAWQGTKVRASSELVGVWASGLPALQLEPLDYFGIMPLNVHVDPDALLAEVEAAAPGWADHYAVYNARNTWQAISLQSYGGDPAFIIKPSEMSKKWKDENAEKMAWTLEPTPLAEQLPLCWAAAQSLGRCHRVRLMRLAPGDGELTRHADITDPDAGMADGQLMRIHLPLRTNPMVRFTMWLPDGCSQTVHMERGQGWSLDTRKPHTAKNLGDDERIHLVVDVEASPQMRELARPELVSYEVPDWQGNRWEPETLPGPLQPWSL